MLKRQVLVALIGWWHFVEPGVCLSSNRDVRRVLREPTLPSWTWAGWHGPVKMSMDTELWDFMRRSGLQYNGMRATLETLPEELNVELTEALRCRHDLSSVLDRYIWIKARRIISCLDKFVLTSTPSVENDNRVSFMFTATKDGRSNSLTFSLSVSFPKIKDFFAGL